MGEYGYDYDTGNVIYHYGDGFATDDAGNEYMDIGDGNMVDLNTDEIHYAPSAYSSATNYTSDNSLWSVVGIGCAILCVVFITMLFDTDPKYFFHAVGSGLLAYYSFLRAKK